MKSAQEDRALRHLGEFFFGLSHGEGGAIMCVQTLATSDALTDQERRFLLERVLPEEYTHKRMTGDIGRRLGATRGDAFGVHYLRDMGLTAQFKDDFKIPWALTMLRFGEEVGLRSFPIWSRRMREWQPEVAQALDVIVADEVHHVALDHAIHARWTIDRPELARIHETLYHDARRIYPITISRSTARTWEEIEVLLDGRPTNR